MTEPVTRPQVFSVYTAMCDETSVETWDEINDLKQIFFDMNWISYDIYVVAEAEKAPEADVKILMRRPVRLYRQRAFHHYRISARSGGVLPQ